MRAPRITLSEVAQARNAASTSTSGACRSLHHHARRQPLRASTDVPIASAPYPPPVFLQDLVNSALKPAFLSSALLAPAPRRYEKPNAAKVECTKPATPVAVAEIPGPVVAGKDREATDATRNKLYSNRAQMIIRVIRLNRILSAMAAFVDDMANPNRTRFSAKELEDLVVALRIQARKHATTRPAPKQLRGGASQHLWRPSRLDPSISAQSLPVPAQCMYAMATIYDACLEQKYQPTAKMVSAMLSTFIGHLSPEQMSQAADTMLQQLVPPSSTQPEVYLRALNHKALSSFIGTYGSIGKPETGEKLLAQWADAQRLQGSPAHPIFSPSDERMDLAGWANNVVIWQSLIKSRIDSGDLDGARKWLDLYRAVSMQEALPGSTPPPSVKPQPYLAYMAGVRNMANPNISPTIARRITSDIRQIVRIMVTDHVPVESSVLAFVISFEAEVGNVAGGVSLIQELGSIIEASALHDADLLRALLQIRKVAADRAADSQRGSSAAAQYQRPPSTRSLVRSLVRVGEGQVRTTGDNLASCRSRGTLNSALLTAMAERDYPAAIVILNLFERWRLNPSHTTYTIVLDALVAQGHHMALFAEPGDLVDSNSESVFNLEATLQSMAREGNGKQADDIRKVLRNQPQTQQEGFSVSARPIASLRQTQYLIRILNRVCAAEFENQDPDWVAPDWLAARRSAATQAEEAGSSSAEAVWKRVRLSVYAAQDELLGKKEQRNKGVKFHPKAPLFSSVPTLSPRRWGFLPHSKVSPSSRQPTHAHGPPERHSLARNFSTSAVSRADSGASCELASAAKDDYTHLEPVRAIYIPGFVPYRLGLALQEHLVKLRSDARAALRSLAETSSKSASTLAGHSAISASASEERMRKQASQDTLLLLQHRPVYTEGRRHDTENEVVSNHLRSLGADYYLTKRGGQITYHGPGQLVGYPILNLGSMNLASRCYVDRIQDSLISLLAQRGIPTVEPPEEHTGVWADEYHKIASIGIQVRHRISSHGFALNVERRAMQGFRHIVACGIVGRNMTCLQDRLDPAGPFAKYNLAPRSDASEKVPSVADEYKVHFANVFRREVRDASEQEFQLELEPEAMAETLSARLNVHVDQGELVVTRIRVDGRPVLVS